MWNDTFKRDLLRLFGLCLLALFLLPGLAYVFVQYAQRDMDHQITRSLQGNINGAQDMSGEQRQHALQLIERIAPSATCGNSDAEVGNYREIVCSAYSPVWQFYWAGKLAGALLIVGLLLLLTMAGLSLYAFRNRVAQYRSFVIGWRTMTAASVTEALGQGALAIWMSYWVLAYFFERISIKLILLISIFVACAAFYAVFKIFKTLPWVNSAAGELVSEADSPRLWQRIRDLAAQLGTPPPDNLVAGIDCNFYVTETPLLLESGMLHGRTLYVSLPLLRVLEAEESDAVLAHELGHLSGGDTAASAALGPKLVAYDHYCAEMQQAGVYISSIPMALFRTVFELALAREQREREFRADRIAADQTSPGALARALGKVAAYANYRHEIERQLFQQRIKLDGELGIAATIAAGLGGYAASSSFQESIQQANIPHPFDSHPPMSERVAQVELQFRPDIIGASVAAPPAHTWAAEILTAAAIEERLWGRYEQFFAHQHFESLAYRYEPANAEELAVVLQFFPDCEFAYKKGRIAITHAGIWNNKEFISWDEVTDINYTDGLGGDKLTIQHPKDSALGRKSTVITLAGLGEHKKPLQEALGRYWQRHQVMRQQQVAATE